MAISRHKSRFFCRNSQQKLRLLYQVIAVVFCSAVFQVDAKTIYKPSSSWVAKDIAVIVNDRDLLSKQIADYYQHKRHIPAGQIIHLRFHPDNVVLSQAEFAPLKRRVDNNTPSHVQGYVLTWAKPYRVACMSIGTAFAAGFNPDFCVTGCKDTRHNPYFDSTSKRPSDDFGWRPTMVLAAENLAEAKSLIDRGVASDYSQPKGVAYLLKTSDAARSSRAESFPGAAKKFNNRFSTQYLEKNTIENQQDVMFYFTGLTHVENIYSNRYLPGAVADHLTSGGGMLTDSYQMSALEWLRAGVTGSYGAVVEPCNFPEKFPNPDVLMEHYLNGDSLIEAYWKSVAEPGQGIFIGEPLAKPFAQPK